MELRHSYVFGQGRKKNFVSGQQMPFSPCQSAVLVWDGFGWTRPPVELPYYLPFFYPSLCDATAKSNQEQDVAVYTRSIAYPIHSLSHGHVSIDQGQAHVSIRVRSTP